MKAMLKSEYFKLMHSKTLWIIMAVLVLSAGMSILTGAYSSPHVMVTSLCADSMVFLLAGAIYAGLSVTADFSNGLIRQYLISGHRKNHILLAKFLHYITGCTIILVIYPLISLSITAAIHGSGGQFAEMLQTMLWILIRSLPLYWSIFSLFFTIAIIAENGAVTMGISVVLSIIMVVFTQKIYAHLPLLAYSPIIQLHTLVSTTTISSEYGISLIVSFFILVISLCISIFKFRHDAF